MANKIEASIKKFLDKNSRVAGKMKKKKAGASPDSTEGMLEDEMARRQKFANRPLPNVLKDKPKKRKVK